MPCAVMTISSDPRVDVFDALADPSRRRLLLLLRTEERSVSELAANFDCSMAAVSQHLSVLRRTGLVSKRRSGRQQLYRLRPGIAVFDRRL